MLKAFLRLWLLVFIPLFYLIFASSYNPLHAINHYVLYERVTDSYQGTFYLIEQALGKFQPSQWQQQFGTIAKEFGHELRLLDIDSEIEHNRSLRELEADEYLIFSDAYDADVIVKRIGGTDWFIYMMLDASEDQDTLNQIQGTLNLLQKHFSPLPPSQWPTKLEALQPHFGFDLRLLPHEQLHLAEEKKRINWKAWDAPG